MVPVTRNLRVSSLISPVTGQWNIDFLKDFVSQRDYDAILDTSIGDQLSLDCLVWPFEKHSAYIVRSGYHWALARQGRL